jgi:nicotinate dehydrogenase subunit B
MAEREGQAPLTRRVFLLASGALAVALTGCSPSEAVSNGTAVKPPLMPDQLDSFLAVEPDGIITVFYGRIDGGQGLEISIAQMVAEELDVPLERAAACTLEAARRKRAGCLLTWRRTRSVFPPTHST